MWQLRGIYICARLFVIRRCFTVALKFYETGRGWIYDTSAPISVYLMTDTSMQIEGDRILYFWHTRSLVNQNAKRHLMEGDNRDKSLVGAEGSQGQAMRIVVEYKGVLGL